MKTWIHRCRSGPLLAASCLCAVACSSIGKDPPELQVRAAAGPASEVTPASDIYYQGAVTAISNRDYGLALDYLQAARAAEPQSARVLNAMGVAYDKLGRFDLSARYYALAQQLDPGSQIVENNLRYSQELQGLMRTSPEPQLAKETPANESNPPVAVVARSEDIPPGLAGNAFDVGAIAFPSIVPVAETKGPKVAVSPRGETSLFDRISAAVMRLFDGGMDNFATPLHQLALGQDGKSRGWAVREPARIDRTLLAQEAWASKQASLRARVANAGAPPAALAAGHRDMTSRPPALRIAPSPLRQYSFLTGRAIEIVNASGDGSVGDAVRSELTNRNWTVSDHVLLLPYTQSGSVVTYAEADYAVAQGLAHTLRFPVRLEVNVCDCGPVQLIIGADSFASNASRQSPRADGSRLAVLEPPSPQGGR